MRRRCIRWSVAVLPLLLLGLSYCSSFSGDLLSPDPDADVDANDAHASADATDSNVVSEEAAASNDAGITDGAPADAPRPIACGSTTCNAATEVCCTYRNGATGKMYGECIKGTAADCPQPPDAAIVFLLASECDDDFDCVNGAANDLVCCHSFGTGVSTCAAYPTSAACTARINCRTCVKEAGPARIGCDPQVPMQCPLGQAICQPVPATAAIIAKGYCQP